MIEIINIKIDNELVRMIKVNNEKYFLIDDICKIHNLNIYNVNKTITYNKYDIRQVHYRDLKTNDKLKEVAEYLNLNLKRKHIYIIGLFAYEEIIYNKRYLSDKDISLYKTIERIY